ncbi:WhiB family transcriptional regulator [Streptomyces jumonjinensis]|uniref:Transcriptional regulator WhiB n=1 Tax=Streptomyces jumonjinensis TaxID=1945 RepID=A0A646KM68_STRJU|nr:WhiB family transcriptional regulator [Streptomyces jumonjinensis]MQT03137.1 WhiB family transcriptional regulator [Streptomyces jumonjinensis]
MTSDLDWKQSALCARIDPDAWYPDGGTVPGWVRETCARCLVRAECLAYALERRERHGVWGGLSGAERRRLVRPAA